MNSHQQAIEACHMSLFPTRDSLLEVIQQAESQAPVTREEVFALLMTYHNTLLAQLETADERPDRTDPPRLQVLDGGLGATARQH